MPGSAEEFDADGLRSPTRQQRCKRPSVFPRDFRPQEATTVGVWRAPQPGLYRAWSTA